MQMKFIMMLKFQGNSPVTANIMNGNIIKKEGFPFSFNPNLCAECKGQCCKSTDKPSYLWITLEELVCIASFLKISEPDFKKNYLRRENGLHNIKDIKLNGIYSCVFLDTQSNLCSIYDVRPRQCKDFPFWETYKDNPKKDFSECIAVQGNSSV